MKQRNAVFWGFEVWEIQRNNMEFLHAHFWWKNIEFSDSAINNILKPFNCKTNEDIFELVGSGSITATKVLKTIYPELKISYSKNKSKSNLPIKLKGLTAGMTYHLAGCCSPIIGDQIVGIVTAGIGVSVHTIDCENVLNHWQWMVWMHCFITTKLIYST